MATANVSLEGSNANSVREEWMGLLVFLAAGSRIATMAGQRSGNEHDRMPAISLQLRSRPGTALIVIYVVNRSVYVVNRSVYACGPCFCRRRRHAGCRGRRQMPSGSGGGGCCRRRRRRCRPRSCPRYYTVPDCRPTAGPESDCRAACLWGCSDDTDLVNRKEVGHLLTQARSSSVT